MKIDVRFRGLGSTEALREHAERRILFQLSRFGHELSAVVVRVSDINGPRGGLDKRCRIAVRGRRIPVLVIEETSADASSAIDLAVGRIARTVGRELERARGVRLDGNVVSGPRRGRS